VAFSRTADRAFVPGIVRWICLGPFLLSRLICFGQTSGPGFESDDQKTIHGTVVNSVTRAPIARALVHSGDDRLAMLTDGDGHFEFTLSNVDKSANGSDFRSLNRSRLSLPGEANGLWLSARKPGFLDDPSSGRPVEAIPGSEVTIPLVPEAVIAGKVNESAGDVAVGVNVEIFFRQVRDGIARWTPRGSARTDSTGEFRFAELQPGTYKLATQEWMDSDPVTRIPGAQDFGFPPVYYPGAPDFSAAAPIDLAAGQTFSASLSLNRQPYYAVKIPVADDGTKGGMNIRVSPQGQRGPGYSLGYNPGTHVIAGSLPNGNYLVEALRSGPESESGAVNLKVAGATLEGPAMTLSRNVSIGFEVKEEFNDTSQRATGIWSDGRHTFQLQGPRSYFFPRLEPTDDFGQGGGQIRPPRGPDDDSVVLENVPPGRYWLRLNAGRGYVASASMAGVDLLREPLVVGLGSTSPIEIRLRDDGAELDGTVAGVGASSLGGGAVQRQAWVYCVPLPDGLGQFQQLEFSGDGKFTLAMLAPGGYRVMAFSSPQPEIPYRDAEAMRAYENKGQVIHLGAGQKATVQLEVISGN